MDSAGRPFSGVALRLSGTPFSVLSDSAGRFRLDSLPAGRFDLIAEHTSYAALGSLVAEEVVETEEGATRQVALRATRAAQIIERLCDGKRPQRRRATLRITMVDSTSGAVLIGLPVWLTWPEYSGRLPEGVLRGTEGMRATTDSRGSITFCDLPANHPLEISVVRPNGQSVRVTALRLAENELGARTIKTTRPR